MTENLDQFKDRFVEETLEQIHELEQILLDSIDNKVDAVSINKIFRIVHTIKGSGGMMGFSKILDITHGLEDIYDNVRVGKFTFSDELRKITFETSDIIKLLLSQNEVLSSAQSINFEKLKIRINGFKEKLPQQPSENENIGVDNYFDDAEIISKKFKKTFIIRFNPNKIAKTLCFNPFSLIEEIKSMGDSLVFNDSLSEFSISTITPENFAGKWVIILSTFESIENIEDIFSLIIESTDLKIAHLCDGNLIAHENGKSLLIKYGIKLFDKANDEIKDLLNGFLSEVPEIGVEEKKITDIISNSSIDTGSEKSNIGDSMKVSDSVINSIRVSVNKVDKLVNLVSELVTLQARLNLLSKESHNQELINIAEKYQSFSKQLRDNAFSISLVPFSIFTTRFKRLVHDLSIQLNKQVEFEVKGDETELDKKIVEQLSDPLMHILRNCIGHGIEKTTDRIASGKPAIGKIEMKIFYQSNYVNVYITDDGKGINTEDVKKKAIEKGFISADVQLTERETMNLIFLPGLSTAKEVSNVSGRGVGLDVVKKNISEIRGDIEIDSKKGIGTTFKLHLPLTLSIIDGLQVEIGDKNFIIPISSIEKIFPIKIEELQQHMNQFIVFEGKQVPYFDLNEEFEIESKKLLRREIVMVGYEKEYVGLLVDTVIGENQTVLKPLGKHFKKQDFISGGTILGDGTVALVLDVNRIITSFTKK